MSNSNDPTTPVPRTDPPRGPRTGKDRRSGDRRAPVPVWRKPWAYAAYGVVGALIASALIFGGGDDEGEDQAAAIERATMPEAFPDTLTPGEPTRDAFTVADYERLVAEGQTAAGQVVRTELMCGSISPIAMRAGEEPDPALAPFVDAEGRVAGAECRWSREDRTSDFVLIVPPQLAEEFASTPEIELNFVRQRVVPANVEWLGRSESLSLRIAGVLQEIR